MSSELLESILKGVLKEQQVVKIRVEKRKGNRDVTVITGLDFKDPEMRKMLSELKSILACGGTIKDDHMELQGDHRQRVKEYLIQKGYSESNIIVE